MSTNFVNFFHLNASITKRSEGHSAVEGCAYILRENMVDTRTGTRYDFRRAHQYEYVVASGTMLCDGAPKEWMDPEVLWNAAEGYSNSKNAQTARRIEIAFPNQLSDEAVIKLTKRIANYFVSQGMCCTWAIHNNVDKSHPNKHAHFNLTMKPVKDGNFAKSSFNAYYVRNEDGVECLKSAKQLKMAKENGEIWEKVYLWYTDDEGTIARLTNSQAYAEGLTKKDRVNNTAQQTKKCLIDWDERDTLKRWREDTCQLINESLEEEKVKDDDGKQYRVNHRSYKDQGIPKRPTKHRGYKVSAIEHRHLQECEEKGVDYYPITDVAQQNTYIIIKNLIESREREKRREQEKKKRYANARRSQIKENNFMEKEAIKTIEDLAEKIGDTEEDMSKDSLHQAVFG